jgi:hypothetical protein
MCGLLQLLVLVLVHVRLSEMLCELGKLLVPRPGSLSLHLRQ